MIIHFIMAICVSRTPAIYPSTANDWTALFILWSGSIVWKPECDQLVTYPYDPWPHLFHSGRVTLIRAKDRMLWIHCYVCSIS